MQTPQYKRILLKISGEALAGDKHFGLDFDVIGNVCDVVKQCVDMGVQVGIVIGGGNFWRGVRNGTGKMERTRADHMGMLATVMNCLAVADVLEQRAFPSVYRLPLKCGPSPSRISACGPCISWKKAAWSFLAAVLEIHTFPLIRQPCSALRKSMPT